MNNLDSDQSYQLLTISTVSLQIPPRSPQNPYLKIREVEDAHESIATMLSLPSPRCDVIITIPSALGHDSDKRQLPSNLYEEGTISLLANDRLGMNCVSPETRSDGNHMLT